MVDAVKNPRKAFLGVTALTLPFIPGCGIVTDASLLETDQSGNNTQQTAEKDGGSVFYSTVSQETFQDCSEDYIHSNPGSASEFINTEVGGCVLTIQIPKPIEGIHPDAFSVEGKEIACLEQDQNTGDWYVQYGINDQANPDNFTRLTVWMPVVDFQPSEEESVGEVDTPNT